MAAVTICSEFGAQENKVWHCFHCFSIYLSWSDGPVAMIFVFWMLNFKPTFSLSSFTCIKRLFSSSSLSAIRVESSAYWDYWYFSLQSWLQLVFHPAQLFSWCILHISLIIRVTIYSFEVLLFAFETSLLFCVQSNCCFLTCIQVSQEAGQVACYSHLFQNFPLTPLYLLS